MKALIKGGLFFALGWLANGLDAQEVQWRASPSRQSGAIAVVAPAGNPPQGAQTIANSGVRPVTLLQPMPLDGQSNSGIVPATFVRVSEPPAVIRLQSADDRPLTPLPKLGTKEPIPLAQSQPLPKDGGPFSAPTPTPYTVIPVQPLHTNPAWETFSVPGNAYSSNSCCDPCGPSLCGPSMCGGAFNQGCCPDRGRFWASAEYLMFWQRSDIVPPLVTTNPNALTVDPNTGRLITGAVGEAGTNIVDNSLADHTRPGARFAAGLWLEHFENLGIEANFLMLGREQDTATFGSPGTPQIFRPFTFIDPLTGNALPGAEPVAIPGLAGTVTIQHFSQLWGAEANLRYKWSCGPNYWVDLLVGYRHLNLSEGIDITENLTTAGGVNTIVQDSFHTRSQFNGGQIGIEGQWRFWDRWSLGGTVKLAMGSTHEIVNIDGSTTFSGLPAPFINGTQPGGLYALPTNMGRYTADRFSVLPEVALKVSYNVTERLQLYVGYDFLYLSSVVRPGNQIDTNVNVTFQPIDGARPGIGIGPRQPTVLFRTSDYWAQGLNFGLKYTY